jgi:diguanylate cyclase (GGDEF)-like protein
MPAMPEMMQPKKDPPPEMPDFVPERIVAGYDSVALLLRQIWPVAPHMKCGEVYEIFAKDRQLHSLPIVDGDRPLGLINRRILVEQFSKRYFRELYGRKPISFVMEKAPLIVDKGVSLDDLSRILVEDGDQFLYDGFIITESGRYLGMGRAHDLMDELSKRKQAHLYHIAHHDMLTGLPNRQLFQDRLRRCVAQASRHGQSMGLLFIDLDHFKQVNDSFGHAAGDALLAAVARRLEACVRASDTVARLGGDEFTVILGELAQSADAALVAEKILRALSQPLAIQGRSLRISASIGVSLYPEDGADAGTLVIHADTALYDAKEGRACYRFFRKSLHASVMLRHETEAELRGAVERGEMLLHYQPQVEMKSGRIVGVEALLRWRHPRRGLVQPADFVPLAEEIGEIVELGEWVLGEACRQARAWRSLGLPELGMAVNVSALQFEGPGLADLALQFLDAMDLPPSAIELELTETAAMTRGQKAGAELDLLRAAGVRVAMDDFGTGYSSLSTLRNFSFDTLKIDRSFVKSLVSSPRDQAISRAILGLAHSMDLKVVAEGVESVDQWQLLKAEGCDLMQGYLCSPALAPEGIEALMRQGGFLRI